MAAVTPSCRPLGLGPQEGPRRQGLAPGPPASPPPFPAQLWPLARPRTGTQISLPPSLPMSSHIVFLFQELLHVELGRKLGRKRTAEYLCMRSCVCVYACVHLPVSGMSMYFACLCVYPCGHMYVFRCVCDSVSTRKHLSEHIHSCCVCLWGHLRMCVPAHDFIFTCMGLLMCLSVHISVNARGI